MIIDSSGFDDLAGDIAAAADKLHKDVGQVVSRGALNIKRQIRKDFQESDDFGSSKPGAVAPNVRYNRTDRVNDIEAEIAPFVDEEGFGSLVGIAIHGGSRGGGGTVADPIVALKAEEPNFIKALEDLAGLVLDE